MPTKNSFFALFLTVFLTIFTVFFFVRAWQEPTQTPPGQNAYAPINVGPNLQIKTGSLQFSSYYGLDNAYFVNPSGTVSALFKGKVGIRTLNPNYPLDVFGDINISSGLLRIEGNEGTPGQVLTRTATGLAWKEALPSCGAPGDYLRWNGSQWVCTSTTPPPPGAKYVFVTAGASPRGDMQSPLGGVSIYAAENFCKYVADTYGTDLIKGKFWVAALSSSGVTLPDGTLIPGSNWTRGCSEGVTYYYPDGSPVGLRRCPQTPQELVQSIRKTESGGLTQIGTRWIGQPYPSGTCPGCSGSCFGWTTNRNDALGMITSGGGILNPRPCDESYPIICWEKISQTPADRIVFTATVFTTGKIEYAGKTGLAAANQICQDRAQAAGLGGTFRAFLSDSTTNARVNIGCDNTKRYVLRTIGGPPIVVADNCDDLLDGTLDNPINRDEFGNVLSNYGVWTGSKTDGMTAGSNRTCSNWTYNNPLGPLISSCSSSNAICGTTGLNSRTDATWIGGGAESCDNLRLLYCFQK